MTTEKHTILVVEDEALLRKAVSVSLRDAGYEILQAEHGEDAIAQVRTRRPELVLLDLIMPRMNGFEVLSQLRSDPSTSRVPVIVMSNLNQTEDVERAEALGAVGYLVKSNVRLDSLVTRVNQFFEGVAPVA
jgi:CheY-like chemotaxis protein